MHHSYVPHFRHFVLSRDEVIAVLGIVLDLGYHLVVNFQVKVRAHFAGDEHLRSAMVMVWGLGVDGQWLEIRYMHI